MLTPTPVPDAWHQVTAPGGYEWWYFDAEDAATDLRIVAIFFQGFIFHPGYLRQYAAYRRRPTKHRPPVPADFPCVYFVVYQGDKIAAQFMTQYPLSDFAASTESTDVTIGLNRLTTDADGSLLLNLTGIPWVLTGRGPQTLTGQTLSAELKFVPKLKHAPMQRTFFSRRWSEADHHWVLADPLCGVTGSVSLRGTDGKSTDWNLDGRGYHDHNYGTGPVGPGLSRWMWGRVLGDDHAMMFHFAQPSDASYPDEVHLLESDAIGSRELIVDAVRVDWSRRTRTLLAYPDHFEAGPLRLSSPRVVDASPFYLRLAYTASVRGQPATAFCEIAYPHRLRWPVLGRMIEMSIDRHQPAGVTP